MWHPHKAVNVISLILIALFLALTVVVLQYTVFTRQQADEKNLLTFTATSPAALKNKEFLIDVAVVKPQSPISGVYFSLTYPFNKMELISIDDWNSPFDIQGEEIKGNGILKYGRDSTRPLSGDQKVVTLKFKSKEAVNLSEITVVGDASLVTPDLKNILSQRPVVTYVDKKKSGPESFFEWLSMIITDYPRLVLK